MILPSMPLVEPLIAAMQGLLQTNLPGVITTANANITDGYAVPNPVQYLDYMPYAAELQGGMPIIAVGESRSGGEFVDDLQSTVDSEWEYIVAIIHQDADHETLVKDLRRLLVCVTYTIQQDRLADQNSVMRQAGAFSVNLHRVEPGPMLGELDPDNASLPPRSWLSWTNLLVSSRHNEQV